MRWLTRYLRTSEGVILITTLLLCIVIGFLNPVFLSAANLLDLVRDSITTGIFAMSVYVALLSGGIDVSFTAIAATAMYGSVKLFVLVSPHAPLLPILLVAAAIGAILGSINGLLIAIFRLPTLIVTLGTLSFFHGFLLTFLGSKHITDIPDSMLDLSRSFLYRGRLADGSLFSLPTTSLFLIAAVVLGGTRISGGHGTVFGTILGVFLVTVINNSLVLIGISSYWERCVIGALIILGAGVPLLLQRLQARRSALTHLSRSPVPQVADPHPESNR